MAERRFLLVAGDPSGDRHGAALAAALKQKSPDVTIVAMGGSHLKKVADTFIYPLVGVGGFGFWEPIAKLPQLLKARRAFAQALRDRRPEAVIPIDFYGFNIHMARLAKKAGIPVYYYVSPQVWASRPHRIDALKEAVDRMLVLFPFEETLYKNAGVPVTFVGHPLLEQLPTPTEEALEPLLGLLPGSRRGVIRKHLPILIATAQRLRAAHPQLKAYVFRPEEIEPAFYARALAKAPWIELSTDPGLTIRRRLWLAIGVSGTAALENMLLGVPMIVMYKLSWLTYRIARRLIRVSSIAMPNLLANASVVPELIQDDATPQRLADTAEPFLADPQKRAAMRTQLLDLRRTLATGGSARAADTILGHVPL